ncbi:ArnT family glycosyltransferase [Chloroflexota bacterium]
MFLDIPKRGASWLFEIIRDRKFLVMLGILALGAYLRLWQIEHLFNVVHDYDPGAYSLGARFITEGFLPYQDFTLVHPPFYNLVLAAVYKIFGYSFFAGSYLSVALSLACVVLIYLVGKKMYHPTAGIIAAVLFAVSPDMLYFGRRVVQETLGIFLILLAIYFAISFIQNRKKSMALLCGLVLGLAVATKYIFVPAAVAIILAVAFVSMGERFKESLKNLGRPALWIMYLCFAAIAFSLVLLLKWTLRLDISVPFIDPMYLTGNDVVVTIFVFLLPLVIAIAVLERRFPFKKWWLGLWELRRNRGLWLLVGGAVLGFFAVTGFFWVKMPQEIFSQTVLLQMNRPPGEFPALIGMIRLAPYASDFLVLTVLTILLAIPIIYILLNRKELSDGDRFLSVALIVSLVLCQGFYHLPRYHVSVIPFLFLGISQLVPSLDMKILTGRLGELTTSIKRNLLFLFSIFVFFIVMSIVLLTNYTGYDVFGGGRYTSTEEQMYAETLDYLEEAGAQKVYAANPIFPALAANLSSTLAFDTFALLWMEEKPAAEIIADAKEAGVDYIILDPWVGWWGYPLKTQTDELISEVRRNSRLVKVVTTDYLSKTEIYLLGAESEGTFNGDFAQWVTTEEMSQPLGWELLTITGEGDEASIEQTNIAGVDAAGLTIYEDGVKEENRDATSAGIHQEALFPDTELEIQVFPTVNTRITGSIILGASVYFIDEDGNALIFGFSDEVDEEEAFQYGGGKRFLVLKNAQLNQWSEYTIDLANYWEQTGWWQPEEIKVYLVVTAHYSEPGYYSAFFGRIETETAQGE